MNWRTSEPSASVLTHSDNRWISDFALLVQIPRYTQNFGYHQNVVRNPEPRFRDETDGWDDRKVDTYSKEATLKGERIWDRRRRRGLIEKINLI